MARVKDNTEGKFMTFQNFKAEYCMESYRLDLLNRDHLTADEIHFLLKYLCMANREHISTILMKTVLSYTTDI